MRIRFRELAGMFAALLPLLPSPLAAQTSDGPRPAAREIVDRVIAQARRVEEQKLLQQYTYRQRFVVEKLDDAGRAVSRDEYVYVPVWADGSRYSRLVEKNGKPVTGKDLELEQKREREFRKRLAVERKKKPADRDVFRIDEKLAAKYTAELLGRERVNGRDTWVVSFKPKGGNLPASGRYERLLNQVAGKLWVDVAEDTIVRAEGHLLAPAKWGWGLMANIYKLDFVVEQTRQGDGVWLPGQLNAYVQGRVLFSGFHQRQTSTWSDFRKDAATGTGSH